MPTLPLNMHNVLTRLMFYMIKKNSCQKISRKIYDWPER